MIGIVIAYYSESFFRGTIQDVFKWSTSEKIKFVGKNFYVFSNKLYFITFGIGLLIITFENLNKRLTQILKNVIITSLIFGIILIGTSTVDANMKIIECTACKDGIRRLHWNEINYGLIIGTSVLISVIPNLIRIIKRTKKASLQNHI